MPKMFTRTTDHYCPFVASVFQTTNVCFSAVKTALINTKNVSGGTGWEEMGLGVEEDGVGVGG